MTQQRAIKTRAAVTAVASHEFAAGTNDQVAER